MLVIRSASFVTRLARTQPGIAQRAGTFITLMLRYPTHKEVAVMHSDGVRLHGRAGIPGTALVGG